MPAARDDVTTLIRRAETGDSSAFDRLIELIYPQLKALAARQIRGERSDHTLGTTALVNEALLRLIQTGGISSGADRRYLFAAAARAMQRVLIDYARKRAAAKRPDPAKRTPLDDMVRGYRAQSIDALDLEEALAALAAIDAGLREVVDLSYFGGLSHREIGELLGVSTKTVENRLRFARKWFQSRLDGGAE